MQMNPVRKYAVPTIRLGQTDTHIPRLGLGTYKYTSGVEPLRYALDLGYTLIDTAQVYGTEKLVGQAIAGRQREVFVVSKVWKTHMDTKGVFGCNYNTLLHLKRSYLDMLMVHFPVEDIPIKTTMQAIVLLKERKKVRHIGVCNMSRDQLREAQDCLGTHQIDAVQYRYNLNRREVEADILPYCQERGIVFMAYEPLDQGRLGERAREALQFLVKQQGVVAIVRSGNPAHLAANIEAACEGIYESE